MNNYRLHRFLVLLFILFSAVVISLSCSKKDEDKKESCCELAGDVTEDRIVGIDDITFLYAYVETKRNPPLCFETADVNNDCVVDSFDVLYFVDYLWGGGPEPECGCATTPEENNSNQLMK